MGGGGQRAAAAAAEGKPVADAGKQEVLIDGRLYDISSFKHPGGNVIRFLTNHGDATDAFREFHQRSERAKRLLKVLPSRAVPADFDPQRLHNGRAALAIDFARFRQQLEDDGMFEPSPLHVAYRLAELVAMHALGLWLLFKGGWFLAPAIFILGLVQGRVGWVQHEGGHYSLTGNQRVDRWIQILLFGFGSGMSASWWRSQHNRHHATPQKLKHDVDLETLPLLAFNRAIYQRIKSPIHKFWLRLQAIIFIPFTCLLVGLLWQLVLHPRHVLRRRDWGEAVVLTLRNLLVFGYVLRDYSWPAALAIFAGYVTVAAAYLFGNFALSHTHLPVSHADEYLHWVEYSSSHTTNITPSLLCNWWMGYLNFQIEHHLFPTMPQFRHPLIAPRVEEFFHKHGLVYDKRDYFVCLRQTLLNLHEVGNDLPTGSLIGGKADPEIKSE